jgi:hypothetical protein
MSWRPGVCTIKHFIAATVSISRLPLYRNKLECLPLPFTSTLVLYLQVRLKPKRVEPLKGLKSYGILQAFPANIFGDTFCKGRLLATTRHFIKVLPMTNTLAYCVKNCDPFPNIIKLFVHNLRIFVKSWSVCFWQAFQALA